MSDSGERILHGLEQRDTAKTLELMARADRIVVRHAATLAVIVWLACCAAPAAGQHAAAVQPPVLRDLAGIPELQALFDRESEKTRVVLLLSPT